MYYQYSYLHLLMKILYLGTKKGAALQEYLVLKKVYKKVDLIDPYKSFILPNIYNKIFVHISPKIFQPIINLYWKFI